MNKSQKPVAPLALSEEQKKAIENERRNGEALGQRAKIALSLIPTLLKLNPEESDENIVGRSVSLAETFMDRLLGIKFEATKEETHGE